MKRIKANQIADGYLSEGMDEGINPEYFIADEAQAEIDELQLRIKGWQQENTELENEIDAYRKLLKAIHSLGNLDEQWNKKIREYLAKGE